MSILLRFFIGLLVCVFITAFLNMLYYVFRCVSIGCNPFFISLDAFFYGVTFYFPFSVLFSSMLLVFYCIRHNCRNILTASVVSVLILLSVAVFIPLVYKVHAYTSISMQKSEESISKEVRLHGDRFYRTDSGIEYLSKVDGRYSAQGLRISPQSSESWVFSQFIYQGVDPKQDLTAAESVSIHPWVKFFLNCMNKILLTVNIAYNRGIVPYLGFASIGITLLGLWALSFVSSWPLLSALFVLSGFVGSFSIYYFSAVSSFASTISEFVSRYLGEIAEESFFIPLVVNILVFVIFSLTGLIAKSVRHKRFPGVEE